jgi:hypothetical protein
MSIAKNYAVVLYEGAVEELGQIVAPWIKREEMGSYILAKKIESNGAYFQLWIENTWPDGTTSEMELQLPHQFIKAVLYAADIKRLGFL